jgi:uncharacterized protein (DUF1697 family)
MTTTKATGSTYVALLRGVNVGGKHTLPMKELVEICSKNECANVRTYIQSGNVVFTAPATVAKRLAHTLAKKIEERFGFSVPVVLRSREQLERVARNNLFLKAGKPESTLYVCFLADEPTAEAIGKLDPNRSAPDEFRVVGSEIYMHFPGGMGNSKLTSAYFDSRLATVGTARNWTTVLKLVEMSQT